MIGSDYCFAIGYDRPVEVVTKLAALREPTKREFWIERACLSSSAD
jgi:hypothetical protein